MRSEIAVIFAGHTRETGIYFLDYRNETVYAFLNCPHERDFFHFNSHKLCLVT